MKSPVSNYQSFTVLLSVVDVMVLLSDLSSTSCPRSVSVLLSDLGLPEKVIASCYYYCSPGSSSPVVSAEQIEMETFGTNAAGQGSRQTSPSDNLSNQDPNTNIVTGEIENRGCHAPVTICSVWLFLDRNFESLHHEAV